MRIPPAHPLAATLLSPRVQMARTNKHFLATIAATQKFVSFAVLYTAKPINIQPQGAAVYRKLTEPNPRQDKSHWSTMTRFRRLQGGYLGPCIYVYMYRGKIL